MRDFHDHRAYAKAVAQNVNDYWMKTGRPDTLVMSFDSRGSARISAPPSVSPVFRASERVRPNDNRHAAGTMRDGVLDLQLEARTATWHPDGDDAPGAEMMAFAEVGKAAQIPGPLIRAGTRRPYPPVRSTAPPADGIAARFRSLIRPPSIDGGHRGNRRSCAGLRERSTRPAGAFQTATCCAA